MPSLRPTGLVRPKLGSARDVAGDFGVDFLRGVAEELHPGDNDTGNKGSHR